jgi:hypothetical protein
MLLSSTIIFLLALVVSKCVNIESSSYLDEIKNPAGICTKEDYEYFNNK